MRIIFLLAILGLFSCGESEKAAPQEILEFSADNGDQMTVNTPTMHYDDNQQATFIKYEDDNVKLRINFRGRDVGTYIAENAIFYKFNLEDDGGTTVDIVCDTFTGIVLEVTSYGQVGELIEGFFTATSCDSLDGKN